MMFSNRKRRYEAGFDRKEGNVCLYRITEQDDNRIVRTFTGTVFASQQHATLKATAKIRASSGGGNNTDELLVQRWCELRPERLPPDGGRVEIDLNELRKH